jgi:hypothetical protein
MLKRVRTHENIIFINGNFILDGRKLTYGIKICISKINTEKLNNK